MSITDYNIEFLKDNFSNGWVCGQLVENMTDFVARYSSTGILLFGTDALSDMTGYKPEEIAGTSGFERVHHDDRPHLYAVLAEAIEEGVERKVEYRAVCKDGGYKWVEMRGKAVINKQTGQIAILTVDQDITERKQTEEARLTAMQAAEAANRTKSEFLANMSHEIRTPMSGVLGMTGLLLETPLTDKQRRYAKNIKTSGESLLALLNDILDFSKVEAGKVILEHIPFSMSEVIGNVVNIFGIQAKDVQGIQPGRCLHDPALRRNRPGSRNQLAIGRNHGRNDPG